MSKVQGLSRAPFSLEESSSSQLKGTGFIQSEHLIHPSRDSPLSP